MGGFFVNFIKGPLLRLTAEDCAIELSVLYAWEISQLIYSFELGLLISHALHFQACNAADDLQAARATHSFLNVNEKFTKLKIGDKSLFWNVFEKVFRHQFYF